MSQIVVRAASRDEFSIAIDWAAAEGWNPGLDDLRPFHAADPAGFVMGFVGAEPVSSISVVRYGPDFGFLGFYIVRPDWRGQGAGIAIWRAGLAHLEGCTIGLDGVVDQQDNYRKSGFALAGRNIRFTGVPRFEIEPVNGVTTRMVRETDLEPLCAFDRHHFPAPRDGFVRNWVMRDDAHMRFSQIAIKDGEIVGVGTIRKCRAGWKIGPLFANRPDIAALLFAELSIHAKGEPLSLDTPEANSAATSMAHAAGLEPVFETARMYRGSAPELPWSNIHGITSFELG